VRPALGLAAVLWLGVAGLANDHWAQWRGPALNGTSTATRLPTTWSATENVLWKAKLPGWSGATPIVWGERVFVASPSQPQAGEADAGNVARRGRMGGRQHPGGDRLLLLCLSRKDGTVLWERTLCGGNTLYGKHNMASPSPVTDGKLVWALTGTGVLSALNFDGELLWQRDLQKELSPFEILWGYGSSPLLLDGKIIVQVLHGSTGEATSYLAAFDGQSGKLLWKHERKTDAKRECPDAYTTPTVLQHGGQTQIVIAGADYVTAHDPASGAERWRCGGLNPDQKANYRIVNSPLVAGDMIYAGSRQRPYLAIRAGGRGDVTASHMAWKFTDNGGPDVPSAACDGKHLYLVNDSGLVTCLDAGSGTKIWGPQRTARGTVSASPLLADGKLYITNEEAATTVLAAGPEFKMLATNELDGSYTLSSPVAAGAQLFIRTAEYLYCIGSKTSD